MVDSQNQSVDRLERKTSKLQLEHLTIVGLVCCVGLCITPSTRNEGFPKSPALKNTNVESTQKLNTITVDRNQNGAENETADP